MRTCWSLQRVWRSRMKRRPKHRGTSSWMKWNQQVSHTPVPSPRSRCCAFWASAPTPWPGKGLQIPLPFVLLCTQFWIGKQPKPTQVRLDPRANARREVAKRWVDMKRWWLLWKLFGDIFPAKKVGELIEVKIGILDLVMIAISTEANQSFTSKP